MTVLDAGAQAAVKAGLEAHTQTIVVTRFSVAPGASSSRKGLSTQGCPAAASPAAAPSPGAAPAPALDPAILDKLSAQIAKRLARKATVAPQKTVAAAPAGALVVTGCITLFEAGDARKRMVGMNMGASRLAAHVRVSQKLRRGLQPIGDVDVSVHGANLLPPLSPLSVVTHVAMMSRQTLSADAGALGNRIAEAVERGFGVDED